MLIGDIVNKLRSALDHLAWQLVLINGGTPTDATGFPIYDSAVDLNVKAPKRLKGASAKTVATVMTVNAYQGGNKRLWQRHKLWNIDKHRLLIPAGSANRSVILDVCHEFEQAWRERGVPAADPEQLSEAMRVALKPADRLYPLQGGAVIFIGPHEMCAGANFEIALGEGQVVEGEELLNTLGEFKDAAQSVVELCRPLL